MDKTFGVRIQRTQMAWLVVLGAALGLALWTVVWNPAASTAAPSDQAIADPSTVAMKLEELHQRVVARTSSQDDQISANLAASVHTITPEQAAMIAKQYAMTSALPTTQQMYIATDTINGRPVYAVTTGGIVYHIDAETGAVIP